MLILPLLIVNIINSDKFILFKQNLVDEYLDLCKSSAKGNYIDNINNNINNNDITQVNVNTQPPHSSSAKAVGAVGTAPSIIGFNYNNLNYLSYVLDLKRAIRLDIINTNHYYLDLLHKNNIITKHSGFLDRKGRLVLEYNIDKILKSRIEKGNIIFEDNKNNNDNETIINNNNIVATGNGLGKASIGIIRGIVNHIKIFTFIRHDFINYNRCLNSNVNINIKIHDSIINELKNNSF